MGGSRKPCSRPGENVLLYAAWEGQARPTLAGPTLNPRAILLELEHVSLSHPASAELPPPASIPGLQLRFRAISSKVLVPMPCDTGNPRSGGSRWGSMH